MTFGEAIDKIANNGGLAKLDTETLYAVVFFDEDNYMDIRGYLSRVEVLSIDWEVVG